MYVVFEGQRENKREVRLDSSLQIGLTSQESTFCVERCGDSALSVSTMNFLRTLKREGSQDSASNAGITFNLHSPLSDIDHFQALRTKVSPPHRVFQKSRAMDYLVFP